MNWAALEAGLPTLVAEVLGLNLLADDSPPVYWVDAERPPWVPDVAVYLSVIAESTTGTPARLWRRAPELAVGLAIGGEPCEVLETIETVERLTIRVRVESMSHNDTARGRLARLRAAIHLTEYVEALDDLGLGLEECGDVQEPSQTYDERIRSIAQCDLRCNAVASYTSETRTRPIETATFNTRGIR